jgi:hypothetical protein
MQIIEAETENVVKYMLYNYNTHVWKFAYEINHD